MHSGTQSTSRNPPPPAPDTPRQHAVVWSPAGAPAPAPLLASLAKRGIPVWTSTSSLLTMAHACAAHASAHNTLGVLVIFCQPAALIDPAQTALAIQQYAPRARCWVYDPAGTQSLRPLQPQDIVNWGAPPTSAPTPGPTPTSHPPLKLTPAPSNHHTPAPADANNDDDTLSPEELRMLLGRDAPR